MGIVGQTLAQLLQSSAIPSWLAVFAVGTLVERFAPAEPAQPWSDRWRNVACFLANSAFLYLLTPLANAAGILIVNACGGGLFKLADNGWGLVVSAALFIFAMDFMEYVFHRAQHRVPFLWAMHSLHHSEPSVNVTTTARIFWLEPLMKSVFVYPVVGVLFQVPATVLAIQGLCQIYHFVNHLNLRVGFGRWWVVLNSPQYHRLHHSRRPEHYDRNFAAFFPVFDRVFGTHCPPLPQDYPPTGLDTGERPRDILDTTIWPLRRLRSSRRLA